MISQEDVSDALWNHGVGQLGVGIEEITGLINSGVGSYAAGFLGESGSDLLTAVEAGNFGAKVHSVVHLLQAYQKIVQWQLSPRLFEDLDPVSVAANRVLPAAVVPVFERLDEAVMAALATVNPGDLRAVADANFKTLGPVRRGPRVKGLGFVRIAVRISFYLHCRRLGIADREPLLANRGGKSVIDGDKVIPLPTRTDVEKLAKAILVVMRIEADDPIAAEINSYRLSLYKKSDLANELDWVGPQKANLLPIGFNWDAFATAFDNYEDEKLS